MVTDECNHWYAGTDLIIIGEHKVKCACGLYVEYEGSVLFYSYPEREPVQQVNLRALTARLKEIHTNER